MTQETVNRFYDTLDEVRNTFDRLIATGEDETTEKEITRLIDIYLGYILYSMEGSIADRKNAKPALYIVR